MNQTITQMEVDQLNDQELDVGFTNLTSDDLALIAGGECVVNSY